MADIIIIDDSTYMRDILREMLEKHGHAVREAATGRLGLELMSDVRPDVITLDVSMPEMNGLAVLQALQDRGIDVLTIMVSADVQTTTRESCLGLGADAFLNEPPRETELIETIEQLFPEGKKAAS